VVKGVDHCGQGCHGAELWSFRTGNSIYSSPAVANGMVYLGGQDNYLYAFHLSKGRTAISRLAPTQLHPNYALRPQNGNRS
jgi:outer membrane protein assembly factor BamB